VDGGVFLAFSFAANSCFTLRVMASVSTLYILAASRRIVAGFDRETASRIVSAPADARQVNLGPGMQIRIRAIRRRTLISTDEPGGDSHFDYLNSVSLTRPITKKLSTYVEFATDISTMAHSSWIGTVDTALIYQPVNNWELDAGVNIGVTKAANDLFTFIGAAWRY